MASPPQPGPARGEIARALLTSEQTMTRRITRANQSIKDSGVPFALPSEDAGRLDSVLRVPGACVLLFRVVREPMTPARHYP